MELKDTVEMMSSTDYRERFRAEYYQAKIRCEKLKSFCNKIEAYESTRYENTSAKVEAPVHDCPHGLLREQQRSMEEYLRILEVRAVIENIAL